LKVRSNRDEEMSYFASYYKQHFIGVKFKDFRTINHEDDRIRHMLVDEDKRRKITDFIRRQSESIVV
jgi:transposase